MAAHKITRRPRSGEGARFREAWPVATGAILNIGWGMRRLSLLVVLAITALLSLSPPAEAQRFWSRRSNARVRPGDGLPDIPGGFTFCRLVYSSVRRDGSGRGWDTDFPNADRNLPTRLGQLTPTPVSRWTHGEPGYAAVQITDPEALQCPFLYTTDVGELGFYPEEVAAMRDYLLKGGLLWVDDYWGSAAWDQFAREIQRAVPEHLIEELPLDHPLFSIVYEVPELPQVPSIQHWRSSGGGTSELGFDSATPHIRAIMDDRDRILVLMTHNTDIGDGWEREAEDPRFFYLFSPDSYAVGINIVVWLMTH